MEAVFLVSGVLILAVSLIDLLWTALWVAGSAGPATGRVASLAWRLARRLSRERQGILSAFGPASLIGAIIFWSGLLWLGWTLVFASDPGSVRDTATGVPGSWVERAYFTGYALFTMGNGDVSPAPDWRIPTVLMNASGIILLTLVVSYLVSVLSAVVAARAFASGVAALGSSPQQLLLAGWDGRDLRALDAPLAAFASSLGVLAERHSAYPVLRYYHAPQASKGAPVAVALLDEALGIVAAMPGSRRPNRAILAALDGAIDSYLEAVGPGLEGADRAPGRPGLTGLDAAGADVDPKRLDAVLEQRNARRLRLAAVVADLGWPWPSDGSDEPQESRPQRT